jgi:hypothetical protein
MGSANAESATSDAVSTIFNGQEVLAFPGTSVPPLRRRFECRRPYSKLNQPFISPGG